MSKGRVLVADGDSQNRRAIRSTLGTDGYELVDARNSNELLKLTRSENFDLVILNACLTGSATIDTCRAIQVNALNSAMIVVLLCEMGGHLSTTPTADSGSPVQGPVDLAEVLARLRTAFQRTVCPAVRRFKRLRLGEVEIDFEARKVVAGNERMDLPPKEFAVLSYLAANANQTITYRELLETFWTGRRSKSSLRPIIKKLRRKIERSAENPQYLLTEIGVGYGIWFPKGQKVPLRSL